MTFDKDSFSDRCNLLIEHLASDALMSCHAVATDMKCRQGPVLHVAKKKVKTELSRLLDCTNLSFCDVLDCAKLSLDGFDCSLDAAVGVAVSDWALFVHVFDSSVFVPALCLTSMMHGSWSLCRVTF